MTFIDVSVPLDADLPTYPGNTPYSLEAVKRLADGGSANVSTLRCSAHTGTHVDAPRHVFDGGAGVEALPLDVLCGPARVIELTTRGAVEAADFAPHDLAGETRVLLKTSNSGLWGSPDFDRGYVGLGDSGARHLRDRGVKLVGVDYLSVEPFGTPGAPAHRVLLGAGIVVVEGLDLRQVEPGAYEMFCLPLRMTGADGAPARVVLRRR
ncbi:MAG: cyclase family protein [Acidobacteria bacterium]|nr:cyclase family protein [Acidobacteriota bacterium]